MSVTICGGTVLLGGGVRSPSAFLVSTKFTRICYLKVFFLILFLIRGCITGPCLTLFIRAIRGSTQVYLSECKVIPHNVFRIYLNISLCLTLNKKATFKARETSFLWTIAFTGHFSTTITRLINVKGNEKET